MLAYVDNKSVVRQRVGIFIRLCNDRYSYFLGKQWNKLLLINLKIGSESFLFAERQQPYSIYYTKKAQYATLNETIEKNFIASFF